MNPEIIKEAERLISEHRAYAEKHIWVNIPEGHGYYFKAVEEITHYTTLKQHIENYENYKV